MALYRVSYGVLMLERRRYFPIRGFIIGTIFPIAFLLFDMNSLEYELMYGGFLPFVKARAIHIVFLFALPIIFSYIEILLYKIQQNNLAREKFLTKMSHEIRTPLNGILGLTEILSMETLKQEHLEYLDLISYSSQNLLSVVNEVLDYSQIFTAGIELNNRNFDMPIMLESIISTFKVRAESKGIDFVCNRDASLPRMIYGDDTKIYQVLNNIIGNAIQFTSDGFVKLQVEHKAEGNNQGKLKFTIIDTGNGVSQKKISDIVNIKGRVMSKFHSTHMGIGLHIVYELIEVLGGTLKIESEIGQGSRFIFEINYQNEKPIIQENGRVLPDDDEFSSVYPFTVLVAEDNMVNQNVLKSLLRKIGYEAEYACNGKEVLEALEYKNYDIIIMDIQMPEMSGYEATEILRKRNLGGNPYIIALTANAFDSDKKSCFDAGMNDFLTKPVSLASIKIALSKVADKNKDKDVA